MKIARRLAHGVASWLRFEFQCQRGYLFEEKYLSYPIGQILHAEYGSKVESEVDHPLLTEHTVGRGKRPKMDFAVIKNEEISLSLESKWIGSTVPKVEDLIWDLIRLELMAHHYNCISIFLLAGQHRGIKKLFSSNAFMAPRENRGPRPILKDGIHRSMAMRLDNPPEQRKEAIKNLVTKYPRIKMPSKISSGKPFFFPEKCNLPDFQVYVWEVSPATPRLSFLAENHKFYA